MLPHELIEEQRGPLVVTCVYIALYYVFLFSQSGVKFYLHGKGVKDKVTGKRASLKQVKYGSYEPLALCADRTVGNTLEQMVPFLISLWLHALVISPSGATLYGALYVLFRAVYPLVFRAGLPWLLLVTLPNYALIARLLLPVLMRGLF